jgi:hypothetical protein
VCLLDEFISISNLCEFLHINFFDFFIHIYLYTHRQNIEIICFAPVKIRQEKLQLERNLFYQERKSGQKKQLLISYLFVLIH